MVSNKYYWIQIKYLNLVKVISTHGQLVKFCIIVVNTKQSEILSYTHLDNTV